jgi:uncharacterized protein YdaU (DUF1376 family)
VPREEAPAFQFYVKEWRSSRTVQRMSYAERGMYMEMLTEQWENLSLPDDPNAVAELLGGTVAEWTAAWPMLRRKFVDRRVRPRKGEEIVIPTTHDASRRIVNLRLERVRADARHYKKNARRGGVARAKGANRNSNGTYSHSPQPATLVRAGAGVPALSSTASPSPSPSSSSSSSPSASALPRAHTQTVFEGSLPRDHAYCAWCSADFAHCVPAKVQAKFIGLLVPKFPNRDDAIAALKAWYPRVVAALGSGHVMGDAFRFWQPAFDGEFASPVVRPASEDVWAEAARKGPSVR